MVTKFLTARSSVLYTMIYFPPYVFFIYKGKDCGRRQSQTGQADGRRITRHGPGGWRSRRAGIARGIGRSPPWNQSEIAATKEPGPIFQYASR